MKNKIAIIGYGGHGKVVGEIAKLNGFTPLFFDDNYKKINENIRLDLVRNPNDILEKPNENKNIFVAIGDNAVRSKIFYKLKNHNFNFPTLCHPRAVVSDLCNLGFGSVVMAGAVLNPSVNVGIGAIINTNCVIEHDCNLGDFVHISPAAVLCGNVSIGNKTWIGAASVVKNEVNIGDEVMIGAGSAVINDVPDFSMAFGVPAKIK